MKKILPYLGLAVLISFGIMFGKVIAHNENTKEKVEEVEEKTEEIEDKIIEIDKVDLEQSIIQERILKILDKLEQKL